MANPSEAAGRAFACVRVCEKLREHLSPLAGVVGYRTLFYRALTLAKAKAPSLAAVDIKDDGALKWSGADGPQPDDGEVQIGEVAVVAQFLGLLVTFIGETLTMQLVRDVWPDAPFEGIVSETEKP